MAAESKIAWTKSTFNPWIGCTKIAPGCDHCYAEAQDSRKRWGGVAHWGAGVPRYRTSESNWRKPLVWNKQAPTSEFAGRKGFWPVFCASLGDVFDNEAPQEWRNDLWRLIEDTPNLSWLLVTKRIGNVAKMVPAWWMNTGFPDNVRLLITVVNQEEADRDVPKLLALPCKNGISYEPALGPVDWSRWLVKQCDAGSVPGPHGVGGVTCPRCNGSRFSGDGCPGLQWIIVGGESSQPGHPARPFDINWAVSTMQQCKAAGVLVFMKQLGSNPFSGEPYTAAGNELACIMEKLPGWRLKDRAGGDPAEWPEDLRVREFGDDDC